MTGKYQFTDAEQQKINAWADAMMIMALGDSARREDVQDLAEELYTRLYTLQLKQTNLPRKQLWQDHREKIERLAEAMARELQPSIVDKHDMQQFAVSAFELYWNKKGCWPPNRTVTALHRVRSMATDEITMITWSAKKQMWYSQVTNRYWTPQEAEAYYVGPEE